MVEHAVRVPRLTGFEKLSTDLTKAPWDKAARLTGNLDWRRVRTADLPITTWLYYDADALYFGYRCETSPGTKLRASVRERDADLKRDDHLTLELDVGPTGRVFYRFAVNPLGALFDSVIIDKSWDSTATVLTATDDAGWTAVMRLPFADFGGKEPTPDSFWKFNIATRSGFDNSWAPVLGGYHTPEQFARLIFAGDDTPPVRMMTFKPLHIGPNTMQVNAPPQTLWEWQAVDQDTGVLAERAGLTGPKGEIRIDLTDDRIDHVNFKFKDPKGRTLLTFWRPAEIPELLSRLTSLGEKAGYLQSRLDTLPEAIKTQATKAIAELTTLRNGSAALTPDEWARLNKQFGALERQLVDLWLYAHTVARSSSAIPFALALAAPMDNVMIQDFPCPGQPADKYSLAVARNESEAVQCVIVPITRALKGAAVRVSTLTGKDNAAFKGQVTTGLVGSVKTKPAGSYLPDYVGWYPDPILDFQKSCDIAVGEHVAFWVGVVTSKDTAPGDYQGTLTVSAEGCDPVPIPLTVRVWDIELPAGTHLRTAFTYTENSVKKLYKGRWSNEMARRYHDFLLDHRLNIDSLYGKNDLNIEALKHGASRGMNAFNLFYVGKGASPEVVGKMLQERMTPLKEAGLDHLAYLYGFDEVNDEVFPRIKEIFGLAGRLYPKLPRMTTGYDNTFGRTTGLRDYVDIWVPLIPEYSMIEAERLRAEGKDMWWYLCVGPRHPYPNWFVDSPAIESRLLMGAMSYKYRVGGVLYFMMTGWALVDKTISTGPYTDWYPGSGRSRDGNYANGDGSLFCAGPDGPVTTLRFENLRDGLEDYEYLYLLAQTSAAVASKPTTLARTAFIQRTAELLQIPDTVVRSSSRYTRDARNVYALRDAVAAAIFEGRALLKD